MNRTVLDWYWVWGLGNLDYIRVGFKAMDIDFAHLAEEGITNLMTRMFADELLL